MGDTIEGSSIAAHSAHDEDDEQNRSFFSRLFSGQRPADETPEEQKIETDRLPTGDLSNLYTLRVEDVAVPRADIAAVSVDTDLPELIKVFKESAYSRLPVYSEALDNPLGLVLLKDVALKYGFNGTRSKFSMKRVIRPLLFAPPSMTIGVLLQKMQADRTHMALVIDEYGGVDGLLTIEDLVEQVVGEIVDEHDTQEDTWWIEEKPGIYLVQARTPLEEFEEVLGTRLLNDEDDEETDTLGGVVFMLTGRVPAKGEIIPHPSGFEFEIVDADPRRIKRLRVCRSTCAE
ncbi:MAG: HlyC/CorC family transporter [Rhodobacteraceae bacterium]|nr:HlyC/CorC family transporter [Paracoccaceae bacterium]